MKVYHFSVKLILKEIISNILFSLPFVRSLRIDSGRTSYKDKSVEAKKLISEFEFFKSSIYEIAGKSIAELGPGDSVGLAPMFISEGAISYTALDRFVAPVFNESSMVLYGEIERLFGEFRTGWKDRTLLYSLADFRVNEEPSHKFDVIVSFNVLEHVDDLDSTIGLLSKMLSDNGFMIHRVDFGPHALKSESSTPFDFRDIPSWLWSLMGSNRGYPNRVPYSRYLEILDKHGFIVNSRETATYEGEALDAEFICSRNKRMPLGERFSFSVTAEASQIAAW